jgi:hypothetical protein
VTDDFLAEEADPRPDALISSLRSVGYTLSTAIADVVDNSISASAQRVRIDHEWDGFDSWLAIVDDGVGMNLEELRTAMTLGSHDPEADRKPGDLGRFGLGLKTASFSQCKKLTVITKKADHAILKRTWDLDMVRESGRWRLLNWEPELPIVQKIRQELEDIGSGTCVIWTSMDRLIAEVEGEFAKASFNSKLADAKEHLGLTFHRFLEGKGSVRKVDMAMNGMPVIAFDPFLLEAGNQRMLGDLRTYHDGRVRTQGFTLPYEPRLTGEQKQKWRSSGWRDAQGFYIYRANRLLTSGGWMEMFGNKSMGESTKHARVRVDLVNSCDGEWKIDILKTEATPPEDLKEELKQIAKEARFNSEEMFGKRVGKGRAAGARHEEPPLWKVTTTNAAGLKLTIDPSHSIMKELKRRSSPGFAAILARALEVEFPIHEIIALYEGDPDHLIKQEGMEPPDGLVDMAKEMLSQGIAQGKGREEAIQWVLNLTPFNQYVGQLAPELIQ